MILISWSMLWRAKGTSTENTANSNERGVLIGDYKLLKEPNQELKKDDFMEIPKIDTKIKEQAF